MIIEDVMDQIGERLDTIHGLHVLPYEADSVDKLPAALVSLPTTGNFRGTYENGMHSLEIVVVILVSMVDDRVRRNEIAPFGDSKGPKSIRQILEKDKEHYTAFDVISVDEVTFDIVIIDDIKYLGIMFRNTVVGSGQ